MSTLFKRTWTEGQERRLRILFDEGLSAREIAQDLGVTRNAVIGKIHRMGWSTPKKQEYRPTLNPITDKTCQYPHGHPKDDDFHFCGAKARVDSSYCPTHHALCYRAAETKENYGKRPLTNWGRLTHQTYGAKEV